MSSYITSILDLSKIITSVRYNDKPASQVLDPFSCLIRLCLLNYKPLGTKLSFTNNKIVFQEPDFLQSAKRWSSGDSRQHIHNLYNPIFKLNQWYDINTPQFIYLLNKSKTGLLQLLKCYNSNDSNIISHSINYYIETINNILEKKQNSCSDHIEQKISEGFVEKIHDGFNEKNKKNKKNKNKNEVTNIEDTKNSLENTQENTQENTIENTISNQHNTLDTGNELNASTDIYSIKLRDLWSLEEIDIIYLLLKQIDKKFDTSKFNNSQSLILSIEDILIGKDQILNTIVNKISTSL
tara:strand:- start:3500 stop:4387 length:888 start_codon:yes stop_codon:yes gene_type:complete